MFKDIINSLMSGADLSLDYIDRSLQQVNHAMNQLDAYRQESARFFSAEAVNNNSMGHNVRLMILMRNIEHFEKYMHQGNIILRQLHSRRDRLTYSYQRPSYPNGSPLYGAGYSAGSESDGCSQYSESRGSLKDMGEISSPQNQEDSRSAFEQLVAARTKWDKTKLCRPWE